jgi:DNA-binding NarL/FixJ family response regulator
MERLLGRQRARYDVVCSVGTATDALAACEALRPDLLILDVNLPDRSGIDALPDFKRVTPTTRVLLCSAFIFDQSISDLVQSGADGFVEKTTSWDDFLAALNSVSRGEKYFCARHATRAEPSPSSSSKSPILTPRETEIARLVAAGLTSKEIATRLGISPATVETHRTNLMAKLGVRNVAGLVSRTLQAGFGVN